MKVKFPNGSVIDTSGKNVEDAKETQVKSKAESYLDKFKRRSEATELRIKERGTIQENIKSQFSKPELIGKLSATLTTIGAPFSAIESAISNPMLLAQQGNFSPQDLLKESLKGLALQKQGQYGDVLKNAGADKTVSDITGLFLNASLPLKVVNTTLKTFGKISKLSDKGIMYAGKQLIKAADDAQTAVGIKVGQAFSKVDNTVVDGMDFINKITDLPKSVIKSAEEHFGNMEDFASNLTIGKLREFKRFLGKLRPTSYGKGERGISETIDIEKLNKVYGSIKDIIKNNITDVFGDNTSKTLMGLEKSYSEMIGASNFLRRSVIEPTTRKATTAGKVATNLVKEGDVSTREALNTLKLAGSSSRKAINKAIRALEMYNTHIAMLNAARKGLQAAVFGGAAGAIGGKALQKATGGE